MSNKPKITGWVVIQAGYAVGPFKTEDAAMAHCQKHGDFVGFGIYGVVSLKDFVASNKPRSYQKAPPP